MLGGMDADIGLVLPSREVVMWGGGEMDGLLDAAERAERDGFDSVWVGESPLARPRPDPLLVLAALAARTRRVRLGTAVLLPLLRHPLTLAHGLATLDRLAGGRLVVGLAPGADVPGTHAELAAVDRPSGRRVGDLMDTVARWRELWKGEVRPGPVRPEGPPLWLGAQGPRMLALTGERFDGWMPFSPTPEHYARGLASVRGAAAAAGRDPGALVAAAYVTVAVDDDPARAAGALDEYMTAYYGQPASVMSRIQACHAGTLSSAADWIGSYVAAGASHVLVRFASTGLTGYPPAARELRERLAAR